MSSHWQYQAQATSPSAEELKLELEKKEQEAAYYKDLILRARDEIVILKGQESSARSHPNVPREPSMYGTGHQWTTPKIQSYAVARNQIDELQETNGLLEEENSQFRQAMSELNARIADLEWSKQDLAGAATRVQQWEVHATQLADEKAELERRIAVLTQEGRKQEDAITHGLAVSKEQIEGLESAVRNLSQQQHTLQQQLRAVSKERNELVSRCESQEASTDDLRAALRECDAEREALRVERDRLQQSVVDSAGKLRQEQADLATERSEVTRLRTENTNLNKQISKCERTIRLQMEAFQRACRDLASAEKSQEDEIGTYQSAVAAHTDGLKQLNEATSALRAQLATKHALCEEQRGMLEQRKEKMQQLAAQLREAQDVIVELQAKVQEGSAPSSPPSFDRSVELERVRAALEAARLGREEAVRARLRAEEERDAVLRRYEGTTNRVAGSRSTRSDTSSVDGDSRQSCLYCDALRREMEMFRKDRLRTGIQDIETACEVLKRPHQRSHIVDTPSPRDKYGHRAGSPISGTATSPSTIPTSPQSNVSNDVKAVQAMEEALDIVQRESTKEQVFLCAQVVAIVGGSSLKQAMERLLLVAKAATALPHIEQALVSLASELESLHSPHSSHQPYRTHTKDTANADLRTMLIDARPMFDELAGLKSLRAGLLRAVQKVFPEHCFSHNLTPSALCALATKLIEARATETSSIAESEVSQSAATVSDMRCTIAMLRDVLFIESTRPTVEIVRCVRDLKVKERMSNNGIDSSFLFLKQLLDKRAAVWQA